MQPIAFTYPEGHQAHQQPGHAERPERVETIRATLQEAGYWDAGLLLPPAELDGALLASIHTPGLLASLPQYAEQSRPFDEDTYLTPASWQLALQAAGGAVALAEAVWRRQAGSGFALCRPPGHHATPNRAMGFCLLNNIALAAQHLLNLGAERIAIVDLDVHHGNGTQDIFYERNDVLFISSHQVPLYPGSGMLAERGRGPGEGFTANLPLPPGSGDGAFEAVYGEVVPALLDRFAPDMLLLSLGLDSHWRDPLASLLVSGAGYGRAVQALREWAGANCEGRIALMLEGGYDLDGVAASSLAAVQVLLNEEITDAAGPSPQTEREHWAGVLDQVRDAWNL